MVLPYKYFKGDETDPLPLVATVPRLIRFEEVDSWNMVWHGRYPSFFEDGRVAFHKKYKISFQEFKNNNIFVPIVKMHLDFHVSLRFDEMITIETSLCWSESLRLNFVYRILNSKQQLSASGYTIQLITDKQGNLLFIPPRWLCKFREKWCAGKII